MLTFAHIINPVAAAPDSRFYLIQRLTFQSLRMAQAQAGEHAVQLLTAQYPEDHTMLELGFTATPDLERSILDVANFQVPRKLPVLQDILDRAYQESRSDYVIYTNVDIGLQPHFYQAVSNFIGQGFKAFVINRCTVSDRYTSISQLAEIYLDPGKPHRGWDCFVFPRALIPDLKLGTLCIGAPLVGLGLMANLMSAIGNFKEFKTEHLTFHLGDDKTWNRKALEDYRQHNQAQLISQLQALEEIYGCFPDGSAPARFLSWQSNPLKAAVYQLYVRYPLPLRLARYFKNDP